MSDIAWWDTSGNAAVWLMNEAQVTVSTAIDAMADRLVSRRGA